MKHLIEYTSYNEGLNPELEDIYQKGLDELKEVWKDFDQSKDDPDEKADEILKAYCDKYDITDNRQKKMLRDSIHGGLT